MFAFVFGNLTHKIDKLKVYPIHVYYDGCWYYELSSIEITQLSERLSNLSVNSCCFENDKAMLSDKRIWLLMQSDWCLPIPLSAPDHERQKCPWIAHWNSLSLNDEACEISCRHQYLCVGIFQWAWVSIDVCGITPCSLCFWCHTPPLALSKVLSIAAALPICSHGLMSCTRYLPKQAICAGKLSRIAFKRRSHVRREGKWPSCDNSVVPASLELVIPERLTIHGLYEGF